MIVKVENLVKRYDNKLALDHFDLGLKKGEILGLLGPNGSGKTSLINCILGILKYDKGNIEVFNDSLGPDSYELKNKIGLVPQEVAVFNLLKVWENVDYFCGLYIKDRTLREKYVEDAIAFVDLEAYRDYYPTSLSGGLKRRLNIACGIAHKPQLIFLDEPTVAVDAQSRSFILEGIKKLNQEGSTIVYTSHYLEEVEELCERILIMDKGKNLVSGSLEELKEMISLKEKVYLSLDEELDLTDDLYSLKNVINVYRKKDSYEIDFKSRDNNISSLVDFLSLRKLSYKNLHTRTPSLNDVFLELTGRELRD